MIYFIFFFYCCWVCYVCMFVGEEIYDGFGFIEGGIDGFGVDVFDMIDF